MEPTAATAQPELDASGQPRRRNGFSLNPFDYLPNMGFGSILMLGLFAFAMYFFGGTDKGKEMLDSAINWLTEKFPSLGGLAASAGLLPDGVDTAVENNPEDAQRAMALARQHGVSLTGGAKAFMKPELLFDMMTQLPNFTLDIARNLPKTGGDEETTQAAMAAIRAIVNDPAKLNTLLSSQHRANTFKLLESMSTIAFRPGRLGEFLQSQGMEGDRPKPFLKNLLNKLLADDEATRNAGMSELLLSVDANALKRLFEGVDPASITDPRLQQVLPMIQAPQTMEAAQRVERSLTAGGTSLAEMQTSMGNPGDLVKYMLNPQHRDAMRPVQGALANLLNGTAATLTAPEDAGTKAVFGFLGTPVRNPQTGRNEAANITALLSFFDEIGKNTNNTANKTAQARTYTVLTGMLGMVMPGSEAAAPLDSANLSAFFRDPKNVIAFEHLLNNLHTERLPKPMRDSIKALKDHWYERKNGEVEGISEVFGDKASLDYLLKKMAEPATASSGGGFWESVGMGAAYYLPSGVTGVPDQVGDNVYHLDAVRDALTAAGVSQGAAAAPAPTARPRPTQTLQ